MRFAASWGRNALAVEFKTHATVIEEVPAALAERLVDQNAGECLRFGHDRKCEYSSGRQIRCIGGSRGRRAGLYSRLA